MVEEIKVIKKKHVEEVVALMEQMGQHMTGLENLVKALFQ